MTPLMPFSLNRISPNHDLPMARQGPLSGLPFMTIPTGDGKHTLQLTLEFEDAGMAVQFDFQDPNLVEPYLGHLDAVMARAANVPGIQPLSPDAIMVADLVVGRLNAFKTRVNGDDDIPAEDKILFVDQVSRVTDRLLSVMTSDCPRELAGVLFSKTSPGPSSPYRH